MEQAIYSDIDQDDPDSIKVTDIDSVYQSIGNILATPTLTRLFEPQFGSELEQLLFDPILPETEQSIYDAIIEAIHRWEPRVKVHYGLSDVKAIPSKHKYDVTLFFTIVGFEDQRFEYSGQLIKAHYNG